MIDFRRESSLIGTLSQQFVKIFLNSQHGVVSLEHAARILWGPSGAEHPKNRRLYDIASVLCALNLVPPLFNLIILFSRNSMHVSDSKKESENI
jgi:hypothetical protein